jgi:hypothetical protein
MVEGARKMIKIQLMLCILVFFAACSSIREGTTRNIPKDALMAEEIATTDAVNAYEAVSLKRPWFLQSRGPRSLRPPPTGQTTEYPVVYLDRLYYGELQSLRQIPVSQVKEIRFLDFNAATLQFGTGHSGGIILVITKGG